MNHKYLFSIIFSILISHAFSIFASEGHEKAPAAPPVNEVNDLQKKYKINYVDVYINSHNYADGENFTDSTIVQVPVTLYYEGEEACQIACLTDKQEDSAFTDKKTDYVIGFIRIKGSYDIKMHCKPYGSELESNLSVNNNFLYLCKRIYPDSFRGNIAYGVSTNTGRFFDQENN